MAKKKPTESNQAPNLKAAIEHIESQFGEGAIMPLVGDKCPKVAGIPTGSLSLDIALGGVGLPRGRIIEIFGPESSGKTTLALHVCAEAQKAKGWVAIIDAEHAFDPSWAKKLGVDLSTILLSQPASCEEAMQIAESLVKSNEVDVIIVDSVAALVPKQELDGEMGDTHVGLQARLMSQAMRKLTGGIAKSKAVVIFINQIREKIGVHFGCFEYCARVVLADGSTKKIGTIVNQRLDVEVLSYNQATGKIEPKRVVGWHRNGNAEYFLQITVNKGYGKGVSSFGVTPNHKIFTPSGEVSAEQLKAGDQVLTRVPDIEYTPDQWQVVLGTLLGDGAICPTGARSRLRMGHGKKQEDYLQWKAGLFSRHIWQCSLGVESSTSSYSLNRFLVMQARKSTFIEIPVDFVAEMDVPAFAVWYMDDGTLSGYHRYWGAGKATIAIKSTTDEGRERLARRSVELGLGEPVVNHKRGRITWHGKQARKFFNAIGRYVPEPMRRKLPSYAPAYSWEPNTKATYVERVVAQEVVSVKRKPETRSMQKFDITVEGNHTYLVDDVIVHNSPETTPGGRALKFYASCRIDIRRVGPLKEGEEIVGQRVRCKVVKNKIAPPFRVAEFDMMYANGISLEGDLLELGVASKVLTKSGAYFRFGDIPLGQGKEKARAYLADNRDLANSIHARILAASGEIQQVIDGDSVTPES